MATRIFLCNEREDPEVREYLREAEESISTGEEYVITWSCANVTSIQPGDRALIKRIGSKPNGYFASGYVVPAEKRFQLRLKDRRYQNLSEAYDYDSAAGNFVIWLAWDTCVDFDLPLRTDILKRNPEFEGALLDPAAGGGVFRNEYAEILEAEWEQHSGEIANRGRGIRLVDVCIDLGKKFNQQKKHDEAIEYYCRALDAQPECVKAFVGLGNAYQALGEDDQAIADYSDALKIGSAYDRVVYAKRGISFYKLKDYQSASKDLNRAIKLDPKNAEAHFYRAMTFYKMRDFSQAIASFGNAIQIDPEYDEAFYFRGRSHFNLQNYATAIADFSQALDLMPDLTDGYYFRGLAFSKLDNGSDRAALQDLRRAAKLYKSRENMERYLKVRDLIDVLQPDSEIESELLLASQSPKLLPPESKPLPLPLPVEIQLDLAVQAAETAEEIAIEAIPGQIEELSPEILPQRERSKAAEKRAIEIMIQRYTDQGWQLQSTESARMGYKMTCTKAEQREDVEIKGVLGSEIAFVTTSREVQQAEENPNFVLWVVTSTLEDPATHRWTGAEMLAQFNLDPMKYLASLNL